MRLPKRLKVARAKEYNGIRDCLFVMKASDDRLADPNWETLGDATPTEAPKWEVTLGVLPKWVVVTAVTTTGAAVTYVGMTYYVFRDWSISPT